MYFPCYLSSWKQKLSCKILKGLICQYFQTPKSQNTVCKWKINILDNHFIHFSSKKGKTKHEKLVVKQGLFWPLWARFRKQDSEHPNRADLWWRHWVESVDLAVYWHPMHSARYWNCVQHASDRKKRRHFKDRISSFPGKMPRNCVVRNCYNTSDNHNLIHDLVLKIQIRMTLSSKCKWVYVSGMWQCIKSGFQQHQQLFVMTLQCSSTCEEIKRLVWTGIGFCV